MNSIKSGELSDIVDGNILELESERIERKAVEDVISINQMLKEGKSIEDILLLVKFSETLVKQVFEKIYQTD